MKKLVFAIMMCAAAMSTNAQVLTSKTVNDVYEAVTNQADCDFVYNAERSGNDITTMYVYKKTNGRKGAMTLKPHLKYDYSYGADGTLTSRITSRWDSNQNDWACAARHDYTLSNGRYSAEYSRYNHTANRFDKPMEKMVYSLMPNDDVNYISYYQRPYPTSRYHLVSETLVADQPVLFAGK